MKTSLLALSNRGLSCLAGFRRLFVLIALAASAMPLAAATYTWQAPSGGDFGDSANWTPTGIPTTGDTARFLSGSGTVNANTLGASTTISQWVIATSLTFDFDGKALISNSTNVANPGLNMTASSATLTDGAYTAGVTRVGASGGSTLNVSGAGTTLTVGGGFYETGIAMTSNTSGSIVVSNGASFVSNASEFDIGGGGAVNNVNALLHITGSGTTGSFNNTVSVGSYFNTSTNNVGTLRISDNAVVTGNNSAIIYIGQSDRTGSTGTMIVESNATYNSGNAGIQVARQNDTGLAGSATLAVQTGGTFTGNSSITNKANGTIFVGSGSILRGANIQNNTSNNSAGESATVMGSGTIRASGGFTQYGNLKPGDTLSGTGIGTLRIGDGVLSTGMTLNSRSNTYFEFSGTSTSEFDRVLVTGTITGTSSSGGDLFLTFNFVPTLSDTFTIMTGTSWSGLNAAGFNVTWGGTATSGTLSLVGNNLIVSNVVAVPEPSTVALLLGGGGALLWMARRRKKA